MKGSLLIEVHGWRGFGPGADLFLHTFRLGIATVGISRLLVTDQLTAMRDKLKALVPN